MDEDSARSALYRAFVAVKDALPFMYEPGGEGRAVELARQAAAALDEFLSLMDEGARG